MYHLYDRILGYITGAAAAIAGLAILLTAFMICYEIVMRGIFHRPTTWVMEIATYCLILAGFLGMGYTMRKHGHICVDFLTSKFSRPVQKVLDIITSLLSIVAVYVCMTESTDYMMMSQSMHIVSPTLLRVPIWIPQSFMLIGFIILFLEVVNHFLGDFFADGKEG